MTKNESLAVAAEEYVGYSRDDLNLVCTECCAEFASKILKDCGLGKYASISCNTMYTLMVNDPDSMWVIPEGMPQRGDYIFFNWKHTFDDGLPLDHVGIITDCTQSDGYTYINYVDANSGTDPKHILCHKIKLDWSDFNCVYPWWYLRYRGETEPTVSFESAIEKLESVLQELKSLI